PPLSTTCSIESSLGRCNTNGSVPAEARTAISCARAWETSSSVVVSCRSMLPMSASAATTSARPATSVPHSVTWARTDSGRATSAAVGVEAVAHEAHRRQAAPPERLVDALPQLPDVDLDDVEIAVE